MFINSVTTLQVAFRRKRDPINVLCPCSARAVGVNGFCPVVMVLNCWYNAWNE